ncbi:DNA oxidative demethylase AlkB [Granulicella mallensis]|uniref:Alpha-ketoglutarate-dependent dioxygenase AlkB n=2 Tax=Granulicella mallensis TaxID=940614 RepID=G8P0C6_GRAMM|nr:DNA oxidative demethylase AlkB [Granulicella mallensis]AEU38014.1 2OG-Fe(II) oxygenase [Granulicella mallensis MP5ACTX8]MBB5062070.1 alkylated DNA repair protein (DNA oxidative demethylase) [Granulicella mallensis]
MISTLFNDAAELEPLSQDLGPGTAILRGLALNRDALVIEALLSVAAKSPFRHMVTPGGFRMSVAMTNCGALGWVTDRKGYRYAPVDPEIGGLWPAMPKVFMDLAREAATKAGYPTFVPDACLINRYEPGARLTLHQDKNENDFEEPIVSVSLGLPAVFLFGGLERSDKTIRVPVLHGDVLVWGGPARLRYHGVNPLKDGSHPLAGGYRFNLTFRKAA